MNLLSLVSRLSLVKLNELGALSEPNELAELDVLGAVQPVGVSDRTCRRGQSAADGSAAGARSLRVLCPRNSDRRTSRRAPPARHRAPPVRRQRRAPQRAELLLQHAVYGGEWSEEGRRWRTRYDTVEVRVDGVLMGCYGRSEVVKSAGDGVGRPRSTGAAAEDRAQINTRPLVVHMRAR